MKKITAFSLILFLSLAAHAQQYSVGAGFGYSQMGKTGKGESEAFYDAYNRAQIIADFMWDDEWGITVDIGAGRAFKHKGYNHIQVTDFTGFFVAPFYEFRIGRSFYLDLALGLAYKFSANRDEQLGDRKIHAVSLGLEPSFGYEINDKWEVFINNRWDSDFYNNKYEDYGKGLWGAYHFSLGISYTL